MKLFDSHCHLDDRSYQGDLEAVIQRAKQNGIEKMMTVGVDLKTSVRAIEIAEKFDGVYASVGVHPHRASSCSDRVMKRLADLAGNPRACAWGETGLDFNRMYSPKEDQENGLFDRFRRQMNNDCPSSCMNGTAMDDSWKY